MAIATITADDILRNYADDIAYVAEQPPAADLNVFIGQLQTTAQRFDVAGINGHEDLETAATFLGEVAEAEDDGERSVFLRKADQLLTPVWEMTDEYRGMVGD